MRTSTVLVAFSAIHLASTTALFWYFTLSVELVSYVTVQSVVFWMFGVFTGLERAADYAEDLERRSAGSDAP